VEWSESVTDRKHITGGPEKYSTFQLAISRKPLKLGWQKNNKFKVHSFFPNCVWFYGRPSHTNGQNGFLGKITQKRNCQKGKILNMAIYRERLKI